MKTKKMSVAWFPKTRLDPSGRAANGMKYTHGHSVVARSAMGCKRAQLGAAAPPVASGEGTGQLGSMHPQNSVVWLSPTAKSEPTYHRENPPKKSQRRRKKNKEKNKERKMKRSNNSPLDRRRRTRPLDMMPCFMGKPCLSLPPASVANNNKEEEKKKKRRKN